MDDQLLSRMKERLQNSPPTSPEVCIFRVPQLLREGNKSAYEPQVVAIGPYHHGKDHLKAVEAHKIHFLEMLLKGRENIVSELVALMRELEPRAGKCYAEPISLNTDDFVEMLLLDGCFILQLIISTGWSIIHPNDFIVVIDPNDFVFNVDHLFSAVCWDLLLVENQLPFFVLWKLSCMLLGDIDEDSFKKAVLNVFEGALPRSELPRNPPNKPVKEIKHLLEFIHHCLLPDGDGLPEPCDDWGFISCSTALQDSGINFEVDQGTSLFNIRFDSGTLKIPRIDVEDNVERFLRNLVAFEQLYLGDCPHLVTDFIIVIDYLIESAKDVEVLCQHKIIVNMLGDNEAVATMFNKLGVHVMFSSKRFLYSKLFKDINKYCDGVRNQCWNKWIAYFKRNYFNSPWAPLVSVSAAALLLLLTVLQTIFTILSYTK